MFLSSEFFVSENFRKILKFSKMSNISNEIMKMVKENFQNLSQNSRFFLKQFSTPKKKIGVEFFCINSFDAEKEYLSIGGIFGAIRVALAELQALQNREKVFFL